MRTLVFALLIQLAGFTGCATTPAVPVAPTNVPATPEALGKKLMSAATAADFKAITALYPTEALMRSVMNCKDPKWIPMVIKAMHTKKDQFIAALKGPLVGFSLRYVSAKKLAEKTFAAGETNKGCTYRVPVRMQQHAWTFQLKKGEKSRNNTGEVVLWYLKDRGWFLVKF